MTPVDIIWLLILLIILLILLLWWMLRGGFQRPQPTPPVGWLLEAWGGTDAWTDECDGNAGKVLYSNLTALDMNVNIEVMNDGDCNTEFATRALNVFLTVLPGKRGAAAIPLGRGDRITYQCCTDESGNKCKAHIRIQKM